MTENDALKSDIEQQAIQPHAASIPQQQPEPSISRRASIYYEQYQERASKEAVACIATCVLLIASAPAIAAVIIASQYDPDNNSCNDGTDYLIDPVTYLYVAGGVQLGMSIIYFFTQIVAFLCFNPIHWIRLKSCTSGILCRCISSCYPLWHLIWACLGVYIYVAQMSKNCQEEDIGIMILAWCIIEFIGVCCISCCIMCWIFMALAVLTADA